MASSRVSSCVAGLWIRLFLLFWSEIYTEKNGLFNRRTTKWPRLLCSISATPKWLLWLINPFLWTQGPPSGAFVVARTDVDNYKHTSIKKNHIPSSSPKSRPFFPDRITVYLCHSEVLLPLGGLESGLPAGPPGQAPVLLNVQPAQENVNIDNDTLHIMQVNKFLRYRII